MKEPLLYYDGYYGTLNHDEEGFHGRLLTGSDLVMYEGDTIEELLSSFKDSVDAYKEMKPSFVCDESYVRKAL